MLTSFVQLALSKSRGPEEAERLAKACEIAERLDHLDDRFQGRIDANKTRRGELPTKLAQSERARLASFVADAREIEEEQLHVLAGLSSAREIIEALCLGMEADVGFWQKAHQNSHREDAPTIQELATAKLELHQCLLSLLAAPELK